MLYNTPLFTFYPSIRQTSQINFTPHPHTETMPVTVTPLTKPIPGIDFPVNHDTYPNDCKNVACKKLSGHYRPGSWVIITQEFDESEEEFFENENYVCAECAEGAKKSFMGNKILRRHEVEPVLKNVAPPKAEIAVSKPLAWVMRPKREVPQMEQTVPIKISTPKAKVLERLKVQKKNRTKTPSPVRARNDRNAANPRPGWVRQTIDRLPAVQYAEVKRQKEKIEAQKNLEQYEVFFELKRARE